MPENGGPLSVSISSGIPIHENKVSNAGKTYFALVDLTSIPKGKRACLSMITYLVTVQKNQLLILAKDILEIQSFLILLVCFLYYSIDNLYI